MQSWNGLNGSTTGGGGSDIFSGAGCPCYDSWTHIKHTPVKPGRFSLIDGVCINSYDHNSMIAHMLADNTRMAAVIVTTKTMTKSCKVYGFYVKSGCILGLVPLSNGL